MTTTITTVSNYIPAPAKTLRAIRKPEAGVGKVVRYRFANWFEFEYDDKRGLFVDHWTGRLERMADVAFIDAETDDEGEQLVFKHGLYYTCYDYTAASIRDMIAYARELETKAQKATA